MLTTLFSTLALLFTTVSSISINNTLYIITNAERPSLGRTGLSPIGAVRAEGCIPSVFDSFNIGLIVVCTPNIKTNACMPANSTAAPLAASLGLVPDTSCGTGEESDDDCVGDLLKKYAKTNTQSILVVWDSNEMDDLLENLNLELPDSDDDDDDGEDAEDDLAIYADIILTKNKKVALAESSMNCTGIDGQAPGI
ncbi:hypothetical protein K438DRAFT_1972553 [Mycena galopus ATCC 62051]|nr:hypothetical protein K438DRAFT_1972553 [Mycena galopus ATCC 62051]